MSLLSFSISKFFCDGRFFAFDWPGRQWKAVIWRQRWSWFGVGLASVGLGFVRGRKFRMSMRYRAVLFLGRAFVGEIGEGIDSVINWFDADIHVLYLLFTAHTACIQTQYF